MNKILIPFLSAALAVTLSCSGTSNRPSNSKSGTAEIKKGVAPIADPEIAVIEMENSSAYGNIKIELYSNIAPKMVARFKELANEGVYSGTTWHRVNESVIQSGDPLSKNDN